MLPGKVWDMEPLSRLVVVLVTSRLIVDVWRVLVVEMTPKGCLVVPMGETGDMWWGGGVWFVRPW